MTAAARFWWPIGATIGVIAIAYGPLLTEFFMNQWERPQYQYFPFVIAAFGWLLWRGCSRSLPRREATEREGRRALVLLLAAAWGVLALAYWTNSPWLAIVSAILLVASRFAHVSGAWRVEYLWGIWAILLLLVPLPLNRDQILISYLQQVSSRLSSFFLDCLGVHHLMAGNALLVPGKEFVVDEACSGIVSVMSVIACAVIYGVWRNRPPVHVIALAVAGVVWATLMNVGRITTIAVAWEWWGVDWSTGTSHEILGLVVFLITFLALVSSDYLLVAMLAPIGGRLQMEMGGSIHYGKMLVHWWDKVIAWGSPPENLDTAEPSSHVRNRQELWSRFALGVVPLIAFSTLVGAQFTTPLLVPESRAPSPHCMQRALAISREALPESVGALRRVEFEEQERERDSIFGQYSRVFRYRDDQGNQYSVSCDFPFEQMGHDLTVCYKGMGWQQVGAQLFAGAAGSGTGGWPYLEARFKKPDGNAGLLVFCHFDEYGDGIEPPNQTLLYELRRSLSKQYRAKQTTRTFQVQVWTVAAGVVGDSQSAAAQALLLAVRDKLRQQVTTAGGREGAAISPTTRANGDGGEGDGHAS